MGANGERTIVGERGTQTVLTWLIDTSNEGIARLGGRANADGIVVHHVTRRADAAAAQARVLALLVVARLVLRAIGTDYALGPAGRGAT